MRNMPAEHCSGLAENCHMVYLLCVRGPSDGWPLALEPLDEACCARCSGLPAPSHMGELLIMCQADEGLIDARHIRRCMRAQSGHRWVEPSGQTEPCHDLFCQARQKLLDPRAPAVVGWRLAMRQMTKCKLP